MRIATIESFLLSDSEDETVLVRVTTDEGLSGYGECTAHAGAIQALLASQRGGTAWDADVLDILLGEDPSDPRRLWQKLKRASFWSYRSGVGHVAQAGVDMALWDLAGKLHGKPVWQLLGEHRNDHLTPYITIWHGASSLEETLALSEQTLRATQAAGYRAAKVEALEGNVPDHRGALELAELARATVGDDFLLLLDVGYRWQSLAEAAEIAPALDDFDLFALEAPFHCDQIDEHLQLRELIETPLATGDMLVAMVDYLPLLQAGAIDYVQAGPARTGISDMDELARAAKRQGRGLVPWGWVPTALSAAANVHVAVCHDNVPLIEYVDTSLYPGMSLRKELAGPAPAVSGGEFVLPAAPGLGVEVDREALERFRVR